MNQPNYPYNQNPQYNPQLPPRPPRKNNAWLAWTLGGVGFLLLLILVITAARKIGNGFGKMMNKGMENQMRMDDANFTDNLEKYDAIYSMLGTDDFSNEIKEKLDAMRGRSHAVYSMLDSMRDSFADTVQLAHAGFLDREISRAFFIHSGRASRIQKKVFDFYMTSFNDAPVFLQANPTLMDNLAEQQGDLSPNSISYRDWVNFKFNQPWQSVRFTLRTLKYDVRDYEADLLTKYQALVEKTLSKYSDTVH